MSKEDRPTVGAPTRIDREQISQPRKDQPIAELRFVNPDGETEVWYVGKGAIPWEDKEFRAAVRMAWLDRGVDTRLTNQRASIERLQKHIEHHHVDISVHTKDAGYVCDYRPDYDGAPES